ncbi:S41 family peptidase [Alterisphingorhabdus coralli]|uniref:S41 family peptidase n=1 Tax=Alterisphingorhabdus coralli TaxID=3071408 RepID=A0AA97F6P5_9SPHN|nr:S41 family peptidase [Parasphingorhabdus sp. SCSIO 66989]WOE74273.1 S41 family peptidase [Parasphingorhabdus sp. SCSIO 66989]
MSIVLTRRKALIGGGVVAAVSGTAGVGFLMTSEPPLAPGPFAPEALQNDLKIWQQALLQRHPRWHGHSHLDDATETAFQAVAASITEPLSRQDAFRAFGKMNPYFRDAHTLLMPSLTGGGPYDDIDKQFPFGVDVKANGSFSLRSSWTHEDGEYPPLKSGTEILAINGVDASQILERIKPYSHGETEILRGYILSLLLPQWLDCVLGWRDRFSIVLREGNTTRQIKWKSGEHWEADDAKTRYAPTISWPVAGTALLRVPTFDVDDDPTLFEKQIADCFAELNKRGADKLVIDIRNNTGGQSDAGAYIIRHLIDKPVTQVSRAREKLNEDNNGIFGWYGEPGTLREFDMDEEQIEPVSSDQRFNGQSYVWIDELSYSASILFATAMQDHGIAKLIGTPTGGFANQTGNMMPTRLPTTGFNAYIATREFLRPNGDTHVGPVVPDILQAKGESDAAFLTGVLS